jgi:hypothetical protein
VLGASLSPRREAGPHSRPRIYPRAIGGRGGGSDTSGSNGVAVFLVGKDDCKVLKEGPFSFLFTLANTHVLRLITPLMRPDEEKSSSKFFAVDNYSRERARNLDTGRD